MRIIDCHYHNRYWATDGECYLETQKKYREQFGLDTINVLCAPGMDNGSPNGGAGHNSMAGILKSQDERVYVQGGLIYPTAAEENPNAPEYDPKFQVQEMMEMGFDGVNSKTSAKYKIKIKYYDRTYTIYDYEIVKEAGDIPASFTFYPQ